MGREVVKQHEEYKVEQLVAVNPYNPDILPDLQNYVNDKNECHQQMVEQFKTLIVLSNYLETNRFRQFWDEAAKNRHIVEVVPGFEQAIQAFAIQVLSLSYRKILRSILAEAINIEGPSLDKFLEHHVTNSGWVLEKDQGKGQLIVLPQNEFNRPELKKGAADSIPLEHITRIFPILS